MLPIRSKASKEAVSLSRSSIPNPALEKEIQTPEVTTAQTASTSPQTAANRTPSTTAPSQVVAPPKQAPLARMSPKKAPVLAFFEQLSSSP